MTELNTKPDDNRLSEQAGQNLFALMCEYFADGWTNARIRELNESGIKIKVDDMATLKTYTFNYNVSILTDSFLNEARALFASIQKEKFKHRHDSDQPGYG